MGPFVEEYDPTMLSITQLRDVLLDEIKGQLQGRLHSHLSTWALVGPIALWAFVGLAWAVPGFCHEVKQASAALGDRQDLQRLLMCTRACAQQRETRR